MIGTKELQASLFRIASAVAETGIEGTGSFQAARELLLRRPPRIGPGGNDPLLLPGEPIVVAAQRLVSNLDNSYLAIQGPPGSGKTTVGAEVIVDLVTSGKRVGVTANSHKVIGQLLSKVAEVASRRGHAVRIGQRSGADGAAAFSDAQVFASPADIRQALLQGAVDVVGSTAWLWTREEMSESVDTLFVDEAGQMSLANVVAVSGAGLNLVLLGDPQQLDQPLTGVHPPGADRSALAHVLGDHQTMPDELGLFLSGTWRLHPDICSYTSEVFYEGRLVPNEGREHQAVSGAGLLSGSGLRYISLEHEGNDSESPEEAMEIVMRINELITSGGTWIDENSVEHQISIEDVLVITPYNAQVKAISELLPGAHVGTVDKFQGQEAPISIYSMATSSGEDAPHGMEFLYSLNRLNVATSRARCVAMVVSSQKLPVVRCHTPRQMQLANALIRLVELAP